MRVLRTSRHACLAVYGGEIASGNAWNDWGSAWAEEGAPRTRSADPQPRSRATREEQAPQEQGGGAAVKVAGRGAPDTHGKVVIGGSATLPKATCCIFRLLRCKGALRRCDRNIEGRNCTFLQGLHLPLHGSSPSCRKARRSHQSPYCSTCETRFEAERDNGQTNPKP